MALIVAIIMFLVVAFVLQLAYNYVAPRLVHSINKEYSVERDFSPIAYWTAVVLLVLVGLVCGPSIGGAAAGNCK